VEFIMEGLFILLILLALLVAFIEVRPTVTRHDRPSTESDATITHPADRAGRKGELGEARVVSHLKAALNPDEYVILNDLILPTYDGTTQIDHVVVSRFGVFVIETKNMKGRILGDERKGVWFQKLYGSDQLYPFQNPVHQNSKHVRRVQQLLSLRNDDVHNVVAFVGSAKPGTDMPDNVFWTVEELADYIKARRVPVLAQSQVENFAHILRSVALDANQATRTAHIEDLRKREDTRQNDGSKCPICGSDMKEQVSWTPGMRFLGCSEYPKCNGYRRFPS